MGLTAADLRALLDAFETSTWQEMTVEVGDDRLHVSRRTNPARDHGAAPTPTNGTPPGRQLDGGPAAVPAPAAATTTAGAATSDVSAVGTDGAAAPAPAARGVPITAPSVGVFWRSPSPGAPPFIEVGSSVAPEDTVGILEIMKLMKPIAAGVAGTVSTVLVENGAPVEFGQALLLVEPEA